MRTKICPRGHNNMNTQTRIVNQVKAREAPLTIKQLAAFTNRTPTMVRRVLPGLLASGEVYVAGKRLTGKRGQPAKLYSRRVEVPGTSESVVVAQ